MRKPGKTPSQVAQQHFGQERPKESDAMRELRQTKEREATKVVRLRTLRLAKEEAEREAAKAAGPKPQRKAKAKKASSPPEAPEA